jgi:hypothetical protein
MIEVYDAVERTRGQLLLAEAVFFDSCLIHGD